MNSLEIYKKTNKLIKKYNTRNPHRLIKELNIILKYFPTETCLLGMYAVVLKNRFIYISPNLSNMENIVLAHELGHDQLHRKIAVNGNSLYDNQVLGFTNQYERDANVFACHLLISDDDIKELLYRSCSIEEISSTLYLPKELVTLKLLELKKLDIINIDTSSLYIPRSDYLKNYRHEAFDDLS